jgi:LPXTG-site transpeptidase (sortase) family protein
MSENVSTEFPNPPDLKPITSLRAQVWRYASTILIVGGLVLMGTGAWMFYQRQIEASKPAPRLVEVSPEDLLEVAPPELNDSVETLPSQLRQVEVDPTTASPEASRRSSVDKLNDTLASESTANQNVEPVDVADQPAEPAPVGVASSEQQLVEQPEHELATLEEAKFLEEALLSQETTLAASDQEAADTVPSLASNPLVVAEDVSSAQEQLEVVGAAADRPIPTRIVADSIGLDADVIEVGWMQVLENGATKNVWVVADFAAGWHQDSKVPGEGGNIVLSGHHNIKGQVFRYLVDLEVGDMISLYAGDERFDYVLHDKFIVKDKGEPEAVRRANAKWIGPFNEERLTLVTCWPFNSNTHRLIVIAKPV